MTTPRSAPRLTLAVEDSRGQQESLALSGPGGTIRIAVGGPLRRSGVWRIWANRGTSDVYVAARELAGIQKFSLHESGDWRYQWVTEAKASQFTASTKRVLDRWRAPAAQPRGWAKGLSIWVPFEDVVEAGGGTPTQDEVDWLPEPRPGFATGIHVVIARPNAGHVMLRGAAPVNGFSLADGRAVLVVVSSLRLDDAMKNWLDQERVRIRSIPGVPAGDAASGVRVALCGTNGEGHRVVWDLALASSRAPRQRAPA